MISLFVQLDTWFVYLIWIGILCAFCCFILLCHGAVLCVNSVLLCCSCYVCAFDCIYCIIILGVKTAGA